MQFIKYFLLCVFIMPSTYAGESFTDKELKYLQVEGNSIKKKNDLTSLGVEKNVNMARAQNEAQDVYTQFMAKNPQLVAQQTASHDSSLSENSVLIFVSFSLGQLEIKNIMDLASKINNATLVFRGIPKDMKLIEAINLIQSISNGIDPVPNTIINPNLFTSYHVTSVPTLIMLDKPNGSTPGKYPSIKAIVHGISDPNWIINEVKHGNKGDFGVKGPIEDISELDLIEVMKQKASEIDWAQKKENALKNFWKNQNYLTLVQATEFRERKIDPTIEVTQDIPLPNGGFLAKKGDLLNPLHVRSFTKAMIIFNARNKNEIHKVIELIPEVKKQAGVKSIALIATEFDKDDGWDGYKKVSNELDEPIYMLTPEIKSRFELEKTPSVITADQDNFIIREFKP